MRSTSRRAAPLLALLLSILSLAGCDRLFNLDPVENVPEEEDPDPNSYSCECSCFPGTRVAIRRRFDACIPPELRPSSGAPDPSVLEADCNTRVQTMMLSIQKICGTNAVLREIENGGTCTCAPILGPTYDDDCTEGCNSVELLNDCSNADVATSAQGLPPVCLAEPAGSGAAGMARALVGGRTTCEIEGTLTVDRDGEGMQVRATTGIAEFTGGPCPGVGCDVHMTYRLDDVGTFEYSSFAGFASVRIEDVTASTTSLEPATLDAFGNGFFPELSLASAGRGTRVDEEIFGVISDTTTESFVGSNGTEVGVGVDWVGGICEIAGSVVGTIEGAGTAVVLHVGGPLVNQPPRANAGADQIVECTSPAGASITLDSRGSTDPDGADDIAFREWRVGNAGGLEILDPDGDGVVTLLQGIGAASTYALNVMDSYMAIGQDTAQVRVVDSTAPVIASVRATPSSLRPRNHRLVPITVQVAAQDLCGTSSCAITAVSSSDPVDGLGDGDTSPDWVITGALTVDLRAEVAAPNPSRVYTLTVTCADDANNGATSNTTVDVVVRP